MRQERERVETYMDRTLTMAKVGKRDRWRSVSSRPPHRYSVDPSHRLLLSRGCHLRLDFPQVQEVLDSVWIGRHYKMLIQQKSSGCKVMFAEAR